MNLNREQFEAVTHGEGPLLVLAGAGSGKTRVLTHRIAYLIKEKNVDPSRILAVTFTNKAASEMKRRVEELTSIPAFAMQVSTFHSFCLKILRNHAARLGYRDNFVVFDEVDQAALIKSCMRELNIGDGFVTPSAAVSKISRLKDDYITPGEFERGSQDYWSKRFATIYNLYQSKLVEQNAMDFGDLIINAVRLLEGFPDILNYFQDRFRHILIDEYQDTNHVQYRLIKTLGDAHKNVVVVGDEDQSIYRWRGADIRNIMEFKEDFPGARVVKLEQNYRSTPSILNAANSVIRNNTRRIGKNLWTAIPDKERLTVAELFRDLDEARYILDEIDRWVGRGYRYDDMAVFYRTNAQSRIFEECFRSYGIPYVIYGGVKFYERMEIKDVVAYLQLILDQRNDTALLRIINRPARGIGKTTVENIRNVAREKRCCLFESAQAVLGSSPGKRRVQKSLASFIALIKGFAERLGELTLTELVRLVVESSGYLKLYRESGAPDAEDRVGNIQEFIGATRDFGGMASKSLPEFLDQIALVSDVDNMESGKGAVCMLTVHLSKGLEFPVVFMAGMEDGLFPHSRSMDDDDQLEEERRLCYVGMTRAREKLYMTYCTRRRLFGREQFNLPSRFIGEIDSDLVEWEFARLGSREPGFRSDSSFEDDGFFDQRPEDECVPGLKVGTRVRHPVFGDGVVQKVIGAGDNQKVMIRFRNGQLKTIVPKYVQLEILNQITNPKSQPVRKLQ